MIAAPLVTILSIESPTASDQAFEKFARFLGLRTEIVELSADCAEFPLRLREPIPGGRIVAFGAQALAVIFQLGWFRNLLNDTRFAFAYDLGATDRPSPELQWLSGGSFDSVSALAGVRQITVNANVPHGDFPVSGQSYQLESGSTAVFSQVAPSSDVESYITVNGQSHFAAVERRNSLVFLLAGSGLVDLDTVLPPAKNPLRPWYAQLIALSIGLRIAAGPWCWTSPVTGANFIIDDPDLKKRYGFFHYESLFRTLDATDSALTVAFIPYNYRRSDPATVALVHRHADRFSIAVHGNDHTGGEYASLNEAWLTGASGYALDRMDKLTRRTGIRHDNVMVFPQGRFSTRGIRALKSCGFTAAANTGAWPADHAENPLTVQNLLQVAMTQYDNFPIFLRRYPTDIFDYAFDALFQKPILAVEHHGFFRNGYEAFTKTVRDLATIKTNLHWMTLGEVVASACLIRQTAQGRYAVRHLAPVLRFKNRTAESQVFSFEKPELHQIVKAVEIGGKPAVFEIIAGHLKYESILAAGQEIEVKIIYHQRPSIPWNPSIKYRFTTALRRKLSDFRDNHLARSEWGLMMVEKIRKALNRK